MSTSKTPDQPPAKKQKRDAAFWFLMAIKWLLLIFFAAIYFALPAISASMRRGDATDESAFYTRTDGTWVLIGFLLVLPLMVSIAAPFTRQFRQGLKRRLRPWIFWLGLAANVVYLNWFLPPLPESKAHPWRSDLMRVQQVAFALAQYVETHDGTLPASLDELVEAGLLDLEKPVTSPPDGGGRPYIYFPEITHDMPSSCIVLASRFAIPFNDGQFNICWFIENGWRVPTPWHNQGRGWGPTQQDIMKRVNAQRSALDMVRAGFEDGGRLERALTTVKNRSAHVLTRSIIAWALGAKDVKAAKAALKEVYNSGGSPNELKFECARALLRVGDVSDFSGPASWIASVKLSSLVPQAPRDADIPKIAGVVEKLNAEAMDAEAFAAEAGLKKDTVTEYLETLTRSGMLSRVGSSYRLARKSLELLKAGEGLLENELEKLRQQHAVRRLKSDPPYLVRKQAIDALAARFPDRLGYEPFLHIAARREAAERWQQLFIQEK